MATFTSGTVNTSQGTGGSSIAVSRTIAAGDLVVVCFTWEDSQTLTSVSDTGGGTWAIATQQDHGSGAPQPIAAIAYCLSHPGGAVTITGTLSGSANALLEADVLCFAPAGGTTFAFDAAATPGTGNNATFVTGSSISTAAAGVVVQFVAGFQLATGVTAGGTPTFTRDAATENTSGRSFAQYLLSGSAQTVTPGASWGAAGAKWVMLAAAFKEVSGGSAPTINTQPTSQTSYVGQTANFSVSATTSGGTLHYQWKDDGANVGTDSSSYTTAAATLADNGAQITCDVTDDNGTTVSAAATWTVLPAATIGWTRA